MSKRPQIRCEDCYFHCANLCALKLETPCPTFRQHADGVLRPPSQAQLIMRPVDRLDTPRLVAQHQAA